jgi:fructan beta-fructosidase
MRYIQSTLAVLIFVIRAFSQHTPDEQYRPLIHFTPEKNWMNDPNGMVYHKGVYHLFYQYHPFSSVWGPMHWGHATSTDLIHWNRAPIALYPDSLGMIFSGSAVVDVHNTSGFGKNGEPPLVAIYTSHNAAAEKEGRNDFETQSIAYSTDNGKSWIKYAGNPVLKNPGIRDFRDPKVMWYESKKKWIMTLAAMDRIVFYSSPNLKDWTRESEFGAAIGAHGGVWECPDLFTLDYGGKKKWILIVNLNPGGPNNGSATQYFIGDFDGSVFTPMDTVTRWIDYGPDEYAGITWSGTGDRKIFLGWMSNWMYANIVPTTKWRSATTIPRELKLVKNGESFLVGSVPVDNINKIKAGQRSWKQVTLNEGLLLTDSQSANTIPCEIDLKTSATKSFSIVLSNQNNEKLVIGYDEALRKYYIDRSAAGISDFHKEFAGKHVAPRFVNDKPIDLRLIIDVTSVELFGDGGLTVMTSIFFPSSPYNKIEIIGDKTLKFENITLTKLNGIWKYN